MISVIIPAHNESKVIARTLRAITQGANPGELEVIVVCNGCVDDTAALASSFGPIVRVVETAAASKTLALNLGNRSATSFPRVYVDADVSLTIDAIRALVKRLERGDAFAVAPTARIDLTGCSWAVRAVFEIRSRLPSAREGIGGSGVYALSEAGYRRVGEFPEITADDGYVRLHFQPTERETIPGVHSTVFPPRTIAELIRTKTRAHYGSFQLAQQFPGLWKRQGRGNNDAILSLFKFPWLWHKLFVYSFVTIAARVNARKRLQGGTYTWQRDETSRTTTQENTLGGVR